jgi:hypothetical protein
MEAVSLATVYQEKANKESWLWVDNNHTGPNGLQDQEMSVSIAEKNLGPDDRETVYKLPLLAVIYADVGEKAKADKTMQRALDAIKRKPDLAEIATYAHMYNARMLAIEHKYKESLAELLLARSLTNDDDMQTRIYQEWHNGLTQDAPWEFPELGEAKPAFEKGDWAKIELVCAKLVKDRRPCADGSAKIDRFFDGFALDKASLTGDDYEHNLNKLAKWLAKYPQSPFARAALAECWMHYAWYSRGHGYGDSVTQDQWKKFSERTDQARAVLDDGVKLYDKNPRIYTDYAGVALNQSWPDKQYMDMVNACHKQWPEYLQIDKTTCNWLLPQWHGSEGALKQYVLSRAEAAGKTKGDEVYAQLVSSIPYVFYPNNPYFKADMFDWNRIKKGYHQIFQDYPHSYQMRSFYLCLAIAYKDEQAVKTAMDGFKP